MPEQLPRERVDAGKRQAGTESTTEHGGGPEGGRRQQPHSSALLATRTGLRRFLEFDSTSVLVALVILALVIGAFHPNFFSFAQLQDVLQNSVYVALLAAGTAFLLCLREIDLSVGSNFALSLVVAALLMRAGMNPWLAAVAGIVTGAVMGLMNALAVQVIAIPAIVATLATMQVMRGLAVGLSNGQQVTGLPLQSSFFTVFGGTYLGLPLSVWILLVVTIALTAVLRLTPFGYRVRAIGSNPDAATFSGISMPRTRVIVLVLVGALCGLAGVLGVAFFTSGDPNIGTGFALKAIAAAVIGGTPLRGGSATVLGAVFGAILLSVVSSGLVYFGIPANWSSFGTGVVILLAVSIDSVFRSRRRARRSQFGL